MAVNQLQEARKIQKSWAGRFPNTLGLGGAFFLLMGGYTIKRKGEAGRKPDFAVTLTRAGFEKLLDELARHKEEVMDTEPEPAGVFKKLKYLLGLIEEKDVYPEPQEKKKENLSSLESSLSFNPFDGEEVSERGNANGVSKAIVLCQTLWFVIQCLNREINRLPVTLVEVQVSIQILYAASMYAFWWYKPLDVNKTVEITLNKELWDHIVGHEGGNSDQDEKEGQPDTAKSGDGITSVSIHSDHTNRTDLSTGVYPIQDVPTPKGTPAIERPSRGGGNSDQGEQLVEPVSIHFDGTNHTYSRSTEFSEDMLVVIEPTELTEFKLLYRTWHSTMTHLSRSRSRLTEYLAPILCFTNAALHAISWKAHFPSPTESLLWKLSCGGMIVFPGLAFLCSRRGNFMKGSAYGVWKLRFLGLDESVFGSRVKLWKKPRLALPFRVIQLWWRFFSISIKSTKIAREESALRVQQVECHDNNIAKAGFGWKFAFDLTFIMLIGYVVCMVYFALEAFISIRSLPKGAYSLPPGSQIMPHF